MITPTIQTSWAHHDGDDSNLKRNKRLNYDKIQKQFNFRRRRLIILSSSDEFALVTVF